MNDSRHRIALGAMMLIAGAGAAIAMIAAGPAAADGCLNSRLARAPFLSSDLDPSRRPVKAPAKPRVPVIMVHGWTGRSTHDRQRRGAFSHLIDMSLIRSNQKLDIPRSLIGSLQLVPGADVYTFDYHDASARWVDDSRIGPALGDAIECLYKQSGQRVIVVAHSMGGLATRFALTDGNRGAKRAGMVSRVVTFGTPQNGSLVAAIAAGAVDAGSKVGGTIVTTNLLATVKLVLSYCGRKSDSGMDKLDGTICGSLGDAGAAFDSEAGRALRYGSSSLRRLNRFPELVELNAIAGDTRIEHNDGGWFKAPFVSTMKTSLAVGDMIVSLGSATDGADSARTGTCKYELNVQRIPEDEIGVRLGLVAESEAARSPLESMNGPCFHTSLMRTAQFTNEALGIVNEDIEGRGSATMKTLMNAWVPSACGHPAGRLKNGILPAIPESHGIVGFGPWHDDRFEADHVAFGDLDGDGGKEAAAMLTCNQGGVAWSQVFTIVGADGRTIDALSLSKISGEQGRDYAWKVTYADRKVHVTWSALRDSDLGCCSTMDLSADFTLAARKIKVAKVRRYTEVPTVQRVLALANGRKPAELRRLAGSEAPAILDLAREYGPLKLDRCFAAQYLEGFDDRPPSDVAEHFGLDDFSDGNFAGGRYCAIRLARGGEIPALLGMEKVAFAKWRVERLLVP